LPSELKINNGWTKYIQRKAFDKLLPDSIAWRKEKVGYVAPQNEWLKNDSIKKLCSQANDLLVENKIVKPGKQIDPWKAIMVSKLIAFNNSF